MGEDVTLKLPPTSLLMFMITLSQTEKERYPIRVLSLVLVVDLV